MCHTKKFFISNAKQESKFFTIEAVGPCHRLAMTTTLLLLSLILENHKSDNSDTNFFATGIEYVQWTSGRVESNLISLIRALKVTYARKP